MAKYGQSYTGNNLSEVKLIRSEPKSYKISYSDGDTTTVEEAPSLSFIELFRFASIMDKLYIFLSIVFSVISGAMTPISILLFSSLIQSMVNYGASAARNKPLPDIFLSDVKLFVTNNIVVGAIVVISSYAATVLMNKSAFNQVSRISLEYLKPALNQDFEYYDTHQTGGFASKMNDDIVKLEDAIGEKLATFIFYQTSFISSIVMALVKGWKFFILCVVLFPVPLILIGIAGNSTSMLSKKEAFALDKAGSIAKDVLSAIRTMSAFSGHQKEMERYEKCLIDARNINIKKGLFNGIARGTLFFCLFSAYALSFWCGFKLMVDEPDKYDVDTIIAVVFGVLIGSSNFSMSLTLMEVIGVARETGAKIFNLINNLPLINPLLNSGVTPETIEGNVEVQNVVFKYPSRPEVPVHSVGNDVREISERCLREQIGLVVQKSTKNKKLFKTTVLENIRYGQENESYQDIKKVTKQANSHEFIIKLPSSLTNRIADKGQKLEGTVSFLSEKDKDEYIEAQLQESPKVTDVPQISFFKVMRLHAPEWKSMTVASICSLVSGSAMPMLAVVLGNLIGILSNPDIDVVTTQVLRYSLIILGIGFLSGITNFVMVYMFSVSGEYLTTRLRKGLFEKFIHEKVGFYGDESDSTGTLSALLSEKAVALQGATCQRLGTVLQAVGQFIFALEISLYYEWRLGWVSIAFLPFMATILYKQDFMGMEENFGIAQTKESMSKIAVEAVANTYTGVSLGREESILHDYATKLLFVAKKSSHWRGIVFGLSRGLFNFMYAVIFYYGGNLMVYERVGYDIILSSAQVLFMGSLSVAQIFAFAPNFQKEIQAAGRVIFILDKKSKSIDLEQAAENFVVQEALEAAMAEPTYDTISPKLSTVREASRPTATHCAILQSK